MQNGIPPTTVRVPPELRSEIERAAKDNNRTFSGELLYRARVGLAVDQHWKAYGAITGPSRLADLERLSHTNTKGDPRMIDDGSPRPLSVGPETGPDTPAPLGLGTNDATLGAINSGARQQISRNANDANRAALADHFARTGGKPWSVK